MSEERGSSREGFFSRWSRVKTEAREAPVEAPVPAQAERAPADAPPPELPPVEELTIDSDFSGFFHPKVDEDVRRGALRKLFSDPHFNVMDGLDVYIDDYSKTEPIPPAMLASLKQAQRILQWAAEDKEAVEKRESARRTAAKTDATSAPAGAIEPPSSSPVAPSAPRVADPVPKRET